MKTHTHTTVETYRETDRQTVKLTTYPGIL